MALTRGFEYARLLGLENPPIMTFLEASGQSFKAGELLIVSSGYVAVGSADPSAETIVGIALHDASGVQGTDVKVMCAMPGVIFEGQLQNGAGTATIAIATHMLAQFGVAVTSNKWWIDTDETSSVIVTIVGFKDAVGTLNGIVEFVFNPLGTIWGKNIS